MKTCNGGFCEWRSLGSGSSSACGFYCNYNGYCDFQMPRDGRQILKYVNGEPEGAEIEFKTSSTETSKNTEGENQNENIFTMAWGMVRMWYWRRHFAHVRKMVVEKAGHNTAQTIPGRNHAMPIHTEAVNREFEKVFKKHWKDILA